MKIGQPSDNLTAINANHAAAAQKAGQGAGGVVVPAATANATESGRSAGVAVTVSTLARGLEKTGRGESSDIDAQKVASVKAAIEDGSYVVNPEAIAEAYWQLHQQPRQHQPHLLLPLK